MHQNMSSLIFTENLGHNQRRWGDKDRLKNKRIHAQKSLKYIAVIGGSLKFRGLPDISLYITHLSYTLIFLCLLLIKKNHSKEAILFLLC